MSLNDKKKFSYNAEKRRKIKEIKDNELNKECFDCGSCYPEYISINNGVFICKDCLIIHNKFPKQISTTLKNNLSSLNMKELQFMYLGGNQKLLEFINYEFPQLQKFKLNILYQTKAMQYYRNNLYFKIYGGPKPIKPSETINAYELLTNNDLNVKNEKIKTKENNKINKINNNKTMRDKKRNKSVDRLNVLQKKVENKEKCKTIKLEGEKKRNSSLLHTSTEDSLKRHKSFYKEMNKLFGPDINNDIDNMKTEINENNDNNVYKKHSIKREYRKKNNSEDNNANVNENVNINAINPKYNSNTSINPKYKHHPIGHIYNNNYFTLSATKNIYMFTPNKESIIYKHRKLESSNATNTNQDLNSVKEVYYKPKIPYLINSNKKNGNNTKLFFSLGVNDNNKNDEKEYYKENIMQSDSNILNKNVSSNTYSRRRYKKSKEDELLEDINKKLSKNFGKDNNQKDIDTKKNNENSNIKKLNILNKEEKNKDNKDKKDSNDNNDNQFKNIDIIMDKKENNNNFIIYRNNKKISDDNIKNNDTFKNKTQLKEVKMDKIINSIKNNINNDIQQNNENDELKMKTYTGIKDRRKVKSNNIYMHKLSEENPIRIEEGEEENKDIYNNTTKNEEEKKLFEKKNDKNIFLEKRKQRMAKFYGKKDAEKNKDINNNINNNNNNDIKDMNNKNEKEKNNNTVKYEKIKIKEKDKKIENKENNETSSYYNDKNKKSQIIKSQELRRSFKKISGENSKNIRSKEIPILESSSNLERNMINSKTQIDMIEENEPKKFSIRNKYKRKNGLI